MQKICQNGDFREKSMKWKKLAIIQNENFIPFSPESFHLNFFISQISSRENFYFFKWDTKKFLQQMNKILGANLWFT